jgi:hypothetical protein
MVTVLVLDMAMASNMAIVGTVGMVGMVGMALGRVVTQVLGTGRFLQPLVV